MTAKQVTNLSVALKWVLNFLLAKALAHKAKVSAKCPGTGASCLSSALLIV